MKTNIKKRKKYLDAGPVRADISNLKVPTLAKKLPNELAPAPKISGIGGSDISGVGSSILDMGTSVLSDLGKRAIDNADPRSNPAIAMKKANTMNTASDLLSAAGKGAAIGGPWGAAAGLLTAGVGKIIGAKKQKSDLAKATSGWASDNLSSYQDAMNKSNYIKGGTIKGSGTGKSDSINMSAKNGSFIVPSENSYYGRQLGEEYLGWKPSEKASKKSGGVDIKASNSEVIYTPEEVRILKYHGVDLDSLAPKANVGTSKDSGGTISTTNIKTGFNRRNNKLAPSPDIREVAKEDPNATFNVSNPVYNALTYKNVIQKLTDSGIVSPDNSGNLTTADLTKMIDENPNLNLSYSQLKKGKTANPDSMGYYEKNSKSSGPQDSFTKSQTTRKMVKPNPYNGINQLKKATGGPVVKTKEKASIKGALVNYMNNPKDTSASMTTANPNNVPVTRKQRNAENLTKWENDPNTKKNIMGMASMSGSISGGSVLNKLDAIEAIANSPKNARMGKAAQDMFRENAAKLSPEEFQRHASLEGLSKLGKYWTYGDVAKNTGYKKGGKIMKKKSMPKGLSTKIKGKKKMIKPEDMEIPGMKNAGFVSMAKSTNEVAKAETFKPKISTFKVQNKPGSKLKTLKPKSPTNPSDIGFAEIAGVVQAAGGAFGLATAKRAPDIGVSETLKALSSDVRKQAAYGLEPDQLNVLNNSIERSRRDTNRFITESGGSGQDTMARLNTTLGTTISGKENVAFQDAAEKARKFSNVMQVDEQIGNQEFDVKRMRREDWYRNQEMFASLLSTGIENVIGSRQFKAQQKMMSERDSRPVFSLKTT